MQCFNGASIARDLWAIWCAKNNIHAALIAKGISMDGVGFGGQANVIASSIPVRPTPTPTPTPTPIVKPVETPICDLVLNY